MSKRSQQGYVLFTVVVMLVIVAVIAFLVSYDSSLKASMPAREAEASRADYVAEAAMQHALWYTQNNACMGDVTIPTAALGADSYAATVTGAAAGTAYALTADQDAWIRNDDVTMNNGTSASNHIKQQLGNVEQVLTRFDVSALPANARINSATAWFHLKALKDHAQGPINVHEITADWAETAVTWESFAASYQAGTIAMLPSQEAGGVWVAINLTGLVQAWVNGQPNYGILFDTQAEGINTEYMAREDGANPPRLEVVVGSGPASPVTIQATGTLDNGNTRSLTRVANLAYQPPNVVTLQLGPDPGADAMLDSFYPRNYGGANYLQVHDNGSDWQQHPLLRFDLGRVPVRAAVLSARLELSMMSLNAPGTATIHRVTRSWVEGTKSGGGIADGATWATYDGNNNWTAAGGDFNAAPVAETTINGGETWVSWEIGPLVEQWLAGEPNNGLLLQTDGALREAKFASQGDGDATVHPKLTITYACECGSACMAPQGSGSVLMVVGDPTIVDPEDALKKSLFEAWGYNVTLQNDGANQASFDSEVASNDVVYISATVDSTLLGNKVSNAPIGVVNGDGWMNDELGFESGNSSNWPVGNSIDITDTSHYITAPFVGGSLAIYNADMGGLAIGNTPAPGLQSLANWGTDTGLAVLDSGALMANGGSVAGRRVMLPFGRDPSMDWSRLSNSGHLILQRALAWGTGKDTAPPGPFCEADYTPAGIQDEFSSSAIGAADAQAITYLPEGISFNGVASPLGGAWILIDPVDRRFYMTDMAGLLLTSLAIPISNSHGGVFISSGTHANHLALTNTSGGLIYVDMSGNNVSGTLVSGSSQAAGIGFVGTSSSGTYDDHILVLDRSSETVLIRTQAGGAVTSFSVNDGTALPVQDVTHLPGTDKVIVTYDPNKVAIYDFTGTKLREYDLSGFGVTLAESTAINPLTCDHVVADRGSDRVITLEPAAPLLPIAHWKLDDGAGTTAIDSEGGHHGTLTTGGPVWVAGTIGDALDFDGSNDYVDLTSDAELDDVFVGGATVMAWIEPASWGGNGYGRIFDKSSVAGSTGDGWAIRLNKDNGGLNFGQGFTSGRGWWRFAESSINFNTWHHVALAYDASSTANDPIVYLDGSPVAVTRVDTPSGAVRSDAAINLRLGSHASVAFNVFDGKIDDARVYDRMLDATEIAAAGGGGGGGGGQYYLDQFNAIAYNGDDGTLTWTGDWQENGESDGPSTGRLAVAGNRLRVAGKNDNDSLIREADLSSATTATLTFNYQREVKGIAGGVMLQVSGNGGGSWTSLAKYGLSANDPMPVSESFDITAYITSNTQIRFVTFAGADSQYILFDDIQIAIDGGGGGGGGGGTFRDEFLTVGSYAGDDGTLPWATIWLEINESDGAGNGDEVVLSGAPGIVARVQDNDSNGEGLQREADLSGYTTATLTFIYWRGSLDNASDYITIDASADGGITWTEVGRIEGPGTDSTPQSASYDISAYIAPNTRIRFLTSSGLGRSDRLYFDNVQIEVN